MRFGHSHAVKTQHSVLGAKGIGEAFCLSLSKCRFLTRLPDPVEAGLDPRGDWALTRKSLGNSTIPYLGR